MNNTLPEEYEIYIHLIERLALVNAQKNELQDRLDVLGRFVVLMGLDDELLEYLLLSRDIDDIDDTAVRQLIKECMYDVDID